MHNEIEQNKPSHPITVTLRQVAAWDLPALANPGDIKVSVPALQRGLVWSPQKVEMLWDSILRGFPIGCLVVCKPREDQQRGGGVNVTHHLLDGQQRSNSIALGFHDPFQQVPGQVRGNVSESILWLDIAPEGFESTWDTKHGKLDGTSTREFLIRVTTRSHPWGYSSRDDAGRLPASEVRQAIYWPEEPPRLAEVSKRPTPTELFPWNANAPVPLAWLIEAAAKCDDESLFWAEIAKRLREIERRGMRWPTLVLFRLNSRGDEEKEANLAKIYHAVRRVSRTHLVLLEAPDDLLEQSRSESTKAKQLDVSHIEQLFQRLNTQGERLDGEELAYSLIKAYWPKVADVVDEVGAAKCQRLPSSALVSVAVRAALTPTKQNHVSSGLGISQLRALAKDQSEGLSSERGNQRQPIEAFLGAGDNSSSQRRLANALKVVDDWLVYHPTSHRIGLPPVVVSSIARTNRSLYTLLLHLADQMASLSTTSFEAWKSVMPPIATLVHWFAKPDKENEIANLLLRQFTTEIEPAVLLNTLACEGGDLFIKPECPEAIKEFCVIPEDQTLAALKLGSPVTEPRRGYTNEEIQQEWKPFWSATIKNRELLLYAQRHYLHKRFPDYDPSRRDLWKDHNRPWDFDHLHAKKYVDGRDGDFRYACREWKDCIGNLRAWPFENNRSDQCDKLEAKLGSLNDWLEDSFVKEDEIAAFSQGHDTRKDVGSARTLLSAIRDRYIRVYGEWYDTMGIAKLFPPTSSPASLELQ